MRHRAAALQSSTWQLRVVLFKAKQFTQPTRSSPWMWCNSGSFELLMGYALSSRTMSVPTSLPVSGIRVSRDLARMSRPR